MNKKIFALILIIGAVIFITGGVLTGKYLYETISSKNTYEEIKENNTQIATSNVKQCKVTEGFDGTVSPTFNIIKDEEIEYLDIDFNGLRRINSDVVAWIYIRNLDISYPIVQSEWVNKNKYLNYNFKNEPDKNGCLFIYPDARPDFSLSNTFIYGHNMKSGAMFGKLKKWYKAPNDINDPYIEIYLPDKIILYRIFAIYRTEADGEMYYIPSESEYTSYVEKCKQLSIYHPKDIQELKDKRNIISLSTCSGGNNTRLLIQAVQVLNREEGS